MKRVILIFGLLVVLITSLVVVGCGGGAQPTGTATGTATATKAVKVTTLKWACWCPISFAAFTGGYREPFAKLIEKKTGGRVKIDVYPSETLIKTPDLYEALKSGVIDMTVMGTSSLGGGSLVPLLNITTAPFLWKSGLITVKAMNELYFAGAFGDELQDIKVFNGRANAPSNFTSRIPIKSVADLKGTKFNATGVMWQKFAELTGSTMVNIPSQADVYDALSKGMIDWSPLEWEGQYVFKRYEVTKYGIDKLDMTISANSWVSMNKDTWNSLPPDIQAIFSQYTGEFSSEVICCNFDKDDVFCREFYREYWKKNGLPGMSNFPAEEKAKLVAQCQPIYDYLTDIADKAGKPGKATLARLKETLAKWEAIYPPGSEAEYKLRCKYPHGAVFPGYTRPDSEVWWAKWTAPDTYTMYTGQEAKEVGWAEYEKYYGKKFVSPGAE